MLGRRAAVLLCVLILLFGPATRSSAETENPPPPVAAGETAGVEEQTDDFGLDDEFEEDVGEEVSDPLIGYNRFMTHVNDKFYFWLLKPVARGFSWIVPQPGRVAIGRCFRNILFPVRLVNNLLQLKFKRAGIETARFGVNTTIGVLGLGDPAKSWLKLDPCEEDFGQTLGHYGVGSGFYLVLPIFGPSNLRDAVGKIPDSFLNPVYWLDSWEIKLGLKAFEGVNHASLHLGEYESLKKSSIDFYIFMRNAYEQNRNMKIAE